MEGALECSHKVGDLMSYLSQFGAVLESRKDHSGYCSSVRSSPDRLPNLLEIEVAPEPCSRQLPYSQYSDSRYSYLDDCQISKVSSRDCRSDETNQVFPTSSCDLIPKIKLLINVLLDNFKASSPSFYPKVNHELNILLERLENVGNDADFRTLYEKLKALFKQFNVSHAEKRDTNRKKRVDLSTMQLKANSLETVSSPPAEERNDQANTPCQEDLSQSLPGMKPQNNTVFTAVPDTDRSLFHTNENSSSLKQELAPSYSKSSQESRPDLATEPSSNRASSTSTNCTRNLEEEVSIVYVKPGSKRSNILKSTDLNRSSNISKEITPSNILSTSKTKNTRPKQIICKKVTSCAGRTVVVCDLISGNTKRLNKKVNPSSCVNNRINNELNCNSIGKVVKIYSSQKPDKVNENVHNEEEISISAVKPGVKKSTFLENCHFNTSQVTVTRTSSLSTCQDNHIPSPVIMVQKFAFGDTSEKERPLPARGTLDSTNNNTIASNVTSSETSWHADAFVEETSIDVNLVEENRENEKEFPATIMKPASEGKHIPSNESSFVARTRIFPPSSVAKDNKKQNMNKKLLLSLLRKVRDSNITDQSKPFSIVPDGLQKVTDDKSKVSDQENIHLSVSGKNIKAKRQYIGIPITKIWDKIDDKTVTTIKEQVNELLSKENASGSVNIIKLVSGNKKSHNGVSEDIANKKGNDQTNSKIPDLYPSAKSKGIVTAAQIISDNACMMDSLPDTSCENQENPRTTNTALNASSKTQVNAFRVDSAIEASSITQVNASREYSAIGASSKTRVNASRVDSAVEASSITQVNASRENSAIGASSKTRVNASRVDSVVEAFSITQVNASREDSVIGVSSETQNNEPSTDSSKPPSTTKHSSYSKLCIVKENSIPIHIKDYITRVVPETPFSKLTVVKENIKNVNSRTSTGLQQNLPGDSGDGPPKIEPVVTLNQGMNEITIYGSSDKNIPQRVTNFIQRVAPETKRVLVVKEVIKRAVHEPSLHGKGNTDECHFEKDTHPESKSNEPFKKVVTVNCSASVKFPTCSSEISPKRSKPLSVIPNVRLPPATKPPMPRLPGQRLEKRHLNDEGKVLFDEYRKLKCTNKALRDRINKLKQLVKDPPKIKYSRLLAELRKYLSPEAYALVSTSFKKALGTKRRGMRFSEELKKVAVSLYLAGPKVYKSWATIFSLPGKCTVKKWLNHYLTLAIPTGTCEDNEAQTRPNNQNNHQSTNSFVESEEEALPADDSSEDEGRESHLYDEINEFINFR